jgi:hypothetical protein
MAGGGDRGQRVHAVVVAAQVPVHGALLLIIEEDVEAGPARMLDQAPVRAFG